MNHRSTDDLQSREENASLGYSHDSGRSSVLMVEADGVGTSVPHAETDPMLGIGFARRLIPDANACDRDGVIGAGWFVVAFDLDAWLM